MSIEYYKCHNVKCDNTFADCGDYVRCGDNCNKHWCSEKCAIEDGFEELACEDWNDTFEECDNDHCINNGCDDGWLRTCNYCNNKAKTNQELIEYVLKFIDRDKLVEHCINDMKLLVCPESQQAIQLSVKVKDLDIFESLIKITKDMFDDLDQLTKLKYDMRFKLIMEANRKDDENE